MSDWLLFDPLFRLPFLTGLCLAVALPMVGALLRARDEWLAALGLVHVAAAGTVLSGPLHLPALLTASLAASLAVVLRLFIPRPDNAHFGVMILIGWSGALLLAGFVPHGHVTGESLMRGQLYFTHSVHLVGAVMLLVLVLVSMGWLQPRVLRERLFPDWYSANRIPAWPHRVLFGALVVAASVLGTVAMGAFAAFALLFVPPWVAFGLMHGWQRALLLSAGLGALAYVLAFVGAMLLDQPFGPTLVLILAMFSALRLAPRAR
ncbi:metal ABC transporter permease [Algiphilus sp.]|uniref:metal ABC transporter permease n=1 Tax=Algiphilus sp. TaxID=1872431 RepID=UPI002A5F24B6|nr:metal ABC transporter permease [Pseudomonadota bacterium]